MNMSSASASPAAFAPLRLGVHLLTAASAAIISPFTALAWPFALLVGVLLGSADAKRMRGEDETAGDAFARGFLVVVGVLGMLFFGAIVGGLIAIAIVGLAAFSEKAAAHASPTDRGVARILLFMAPIVAWLIVFPILGMDVDIRIGA